MVHRTWPAIAFCAGWLGLGPAPAPAALLNRETLAGFERYIAAREARLEQRLQPGANFLWVDDSPERKSRLRHGEIVVQPARGNGQVSVPDGLVHDWIGAVFIPGATLDNTFAVIDDYDHYKDYYKPWVLKSKLLGHAANEYRWSMRLLRKQILTVVIDGEYVSRYEWLDGTRRYDRSSSTRLAEVENAGEPGEHELPPDDGHGFLWRLDAFSRFEERDGGVYVELEPIALSRSVPVVLRWFVQPIIRRVSRDSLTTILKATRTAVLKRVHSLNAPEVISYPALQQTIVLPPRSLAQYNKGSERAR